jgi:hypothetical protein
MVRTEIVDYLRQNLGAFSEEDLRRQLREEGVSDADFEDSLVVVRLNPKPTALRAAPKNPEKDRRRTMMLAAVLGSVLLLALGVLMLMTPSKPASAAADAASAGDAASTGETGFIGHAGWVVRLPQNYAAVRQFNDAAKTDEVVHFCPRGTDQTNFIDEELFGQLGIVRVEVAHSDFPANPTGVAQLSRRVAEKLRSAKYTSKPLQIGNLSGVQANVQTPFPHVEAYLIGQSDVYFFFAGQEDDVWRAIVLSLRDAHSEN